MDRSSSHLVCLPQRIGEELVRILAKKAPSLDGFVVMPGKESICFLLPMPAIIIASVLYRSERSHFAQLHEGCSGPMTRFAGALSAIADPGYGD